MENRMSSIEISVQGVNTALGDVNSKLDLLIRTGTSQAPESDAESDATGESDQSGPGQLLESSFGVIRTRDETIAELQGRIRVLTRENQAVHVDEEANAAHLQALESARADIQNRDAMVAQLEERIRVLTRENQAVHVDEEANAAHLEALESARNCIRNRDATVAQLEERIRVLTAEKQQYEQLQHQQQLAANGSIQELVDSHKQQILEEQRENNVLKETVADLTETIQRMEVDYNTLNGKISEEQGQNKVLEETVADLTETIQNMQVDYNTLNGYYKGILDAKLTSDRDVRRLQQEIKQLSQTSQQQTPLQTPLQPLQPALVPVRDEFDEIDDPKTQKHLLDSLLQMISEQIEGSSKGSGLLLAGEELKKHVAYKLKRMLNSRIQDLFWSFLSHVAIFSRINFVNPDPDREILIAKQQDFCKFLFKYVADPVDNALQIKDLLATVRALHRDLSPGTQQVNDREKHLQMAIIELLFIIAQDERIHIIDSGDSSIIPSYFLLSICEIFGIRSHFGFLEYTNPRQHHEGLFSGPFPFSKHTFPLRIRSLREDGTIFSDLRAIQLRLPPHTDPGQHKIIKVGKTNELNATDKKALESIELADTISIWLPNTIQDRVLGFLVKRPQNLFELRCFLYDPMISITQYKILVNDMCRMSNQQNYAKVIDDMINITTTRPQAIYVTAIVMLSILQRICEIALNLGPSSPDYTMTFSYPDDPHDFTMRYAGKGDIQAIPENQKLGVTIPDIVFTRPASIMRGQMTTQIHKVSNDQIYDALVGRKILGSNILNRVNFEIIVFFKILMQNITPSTSIGLTDAFAHVVESQQLHRDRETLNQYDFIDFIEKCPVIFCSKNFTRTEMILEDLYEDTILEKGNIKKGMKTLEGNDTSIADLFSRIAQAQNANMWQTPSKTQAEGTDYVEDVEAGAFEPPIPVVVPLENPTTFFPVVPNPPTNNTGAATNAPASLEVVESSADRQWLEEKIMQLQNNLKETKRRVMSSGDPWVPNDKTRDQNPLGYFRQQMKTYVYPDVKKIPDRKSRDAIFEGSDINFYKSGGALSKQWASGANSKKPTQIEMKRFIERLKTDVNLKATFDTKWDMLKTDPRWKEILDDIKGLI